MIHSNTQSMTMCLSRWDQFIEHFCLAISSNFIKQKKFRTIEQTSLLYLSSWEKLCNEINRFQTVLSNSFNILDQIRFVKKATIKSSLEFFDFYLPDRFQVVDKQLALQYHILLYMNNDQNKRHIEIWMPTIDIKNNRIYHYKNPSSHIYRE